MCQVVAIPGAAGRDTVRAGGRAKMRSGIPRTKGAVVSELTGPTILLYSDDVDARSQVRLAVGRRLERGAPDITWIDVATADEVLAHVRTAPPDLLILDGEADKVGGMGVSRQLKDEIYECPPVLVLLGRPQDAWLASWSDADAVVSRPLEPIAVREAVVGLLTRSIATR